MDTIDHASKDELYGVQTALNKLEGRVEQGFSHIETKLETFDTKYARQDAVMALHEKAYNNTKVIGDIEVRHANEIGQINTSIATLSEQVKNLSRYVIGGVFLMIISLVISKLI